MRKDIDIDLHIHTIIIQRLFLLLSTLMVR